ncbi:tripartite tricarboxylate transporter TctB family protein [Lentibacillus populi]|uniref:tripartite tricarboxylate transporter TctB family protein n=1 Tax=Lentibacillus populi TaxID=1827502 RepID=UPI00166DB071|nr:tripartite tricarboxylate transporter TctB family protein [Lentibacillus populi]
MATKNQRERYTWLVFLIGGILLWKVIIPTQIQTSQNSTNFGPELFPNMLAIVIILVSGLSFIGTFIKKDAEVTKTTGEPGKILASILVFAITIVYAYIIDIIHFIPASIICMFLIMWILSVRKWYLYLVMLGLIFLVKFIFEDIMYINLP